MRPRILEMACSSDSPWRVRLRGCACHAEARGVQSFVPWRASATTRLPTLPSVSFREPRRNQVPLSATQFSGESSPNGLGRPRLAAASNPLDLESRVGVASPRGQSRHANSFCTAAVHATEEGKREDIHLISLAHDFPGAMVEIYIKPAGINERLAAGRRVKESVGKETRLWRARRVQ